jgi:transcriptional regulator with XRE-family HTH domain
MIDPAQLGALLRERRGRLGWSLRRAANEIGVSFNTIARVERGHIPDLDTYRKLGEWLGVAGTETEAVGSTVEVINSHLRHDAALSEEDAQRIGRVIRELYEALARPTATSAVHLRTATTFKPSAAHLLGELLTDMRASLEREIAAR